MSVPTETLAGSFERLVTPLMEQILSNLRESRALTELRDTLLPQLISGGIRVTEEKVQ